MEPRIQYAKTSDGVNIAFWAMGTGPTLVIPPNLAGCHLQMELEMPHSRIVYSRLAEQLTVVRYDSRGMGMSQRDAIDFSVEAAERDLDAVVDRLGLERFALYGHIVAGQLPFVYATRHSNRLSCLVFWVGRTIVGNPQIMSRLSVIDPLMDQDWELYVNLRSRVMFGWDSPVATPFAALLQAAHSPASLRKAGEVLAEARVAGPPEGVRVPTVVFHLAASPTTMRIAQGIASGIAGAHVVAIPGPRQTLNPFIYDSDVLTDAIVDTVRAADSGDDAMAEPPALNLSAFRAILWSDIEGHTALMERLGDAEGRDVLREHERLTRETLALHNGIEIKAMGDGFMAWFPSAQQALSCAVALQKRFLERNRTSAAPITIRIGVNAGEPIAEEDPGGRTDLFGASVITAARICDEARGGGIVASDVVRQLVAGKGFDFTERGLVPLKGFSEPVRVFEVSWRDTTAS